MEPLVAMYRLFALGVVAFSVIQIVTAFRRPPDWQPPRADQFPIRVTRDRYIAGGVVGIIAGGAVFALSFVLFR